MTVSLCVVRDEDERKGEGKFHEPEMLCTFPLSFSLHIPIDKTNPTVIFSKKLIIIDVEGVPNCHNQQHVSEVDSS